MSDLVDRIKKQVGMDDDGCMCCNVSNCCGSLPDALEEITRLEAQVEAYRNALNGFWGVGWENRIGCSSPLHKAGQPSCPACLQETRI